MSFNWCFIGTGKIAHRVAKQVVAIDGHRIVSVYNRTKEKAYTFANIYQSRVYDTALEAIKDPEVNGVYIATTNETHFSFIQLCLEHHKPVLCEKPITGNAKEFKKILDLNADSNTFLCEAMWTWFNPVSYQVKKWVEEKQIGKIRHVECRFCVPLIGRKKIERHVKINKYGGALLDLGVYCVRYIYELFGKPNKITSKGKLFQGVDIRNKSIFSYENFDAVVVSGFNSIPVDYCIIKGDLGTIKVPLFHKANKAILRNKNGRVVYKNLEPKFSYQFLQVSEDIINGNKESLISWNSSLEVLKIMDAIRQQINVIYPCD